MEKKDKGKPTEQQRNLSQKRMMDKMVIEGTTRVDHHKRESLGKKKEGSKEEEKKFKCRYGLGSQVSTI